MSKKNTGGCVVAPGWPGGKPALAGCNPCYASTGDVKKTGVGPSDDVELVEVQPSKHGTSLNLAKSQSGFEKTAQGNERDDYTDVS